jgi:hypothetical protein
VQPLSTSPIFFNFLLVGVPGFFIAAQPVCFSYRARARWWQSSEGASSEDFFKSFHDLAEAFAAKNVYVVRFAG